MERSSRRDFLRLAAGQAARKAVELAPLGASLTLLGDTALIPRQETSHGPRPKRSRPSTPTKAFVGVDEAIEIAAGLGLGGRSSEVRALARHSWRIHPGDTELEPIGFANGTPRLPDSISWPGADGQQLRFIAQVNLGRLPEAGETRFSEGQIWIFHSEPRPDLPAGTGVTGIVVDPAQGVGADAAPIEIPTDSTPLAVSGELTLPRPWSAAVDAIGLDHEERESWQVLRRTLAERQGVELGDTTVDIVALHRAFGHPDERRGDMPLACELMRRGIDVADEPPRMHPQANEIEAESVGWRLLLQLASDDDLGWRWGSRRERLYLWVDEDDLRAAAFDRARAIVQ